MMKKFMHSKSIIALFLITALLMSAVLTGCEGKTGQSGNSGSKSESNVTIENVDDFSVEGTTHIFNISDTDAFIARNGKSDYAVVIASDADSRVQTAAKDFVNFFLEATEIYLPTVYAEDAGYDSNSKYIVIGNNVVSEKAGMKPDASVLGAHGFQIKTVGSSIFVFGTGNEGAQFGTYELLTQLFHFDTFASNCYYIDKNVKEVPLKNYDVTDVPDIPVRADNYQFIKTDITTRDRLRLITGGLIMIPVGGKTVHNSPEYLKPEDYPDHEAWFSTTGKNLCYTARGDADELKLMQETVADIMIEHFKQYPDRSIISLTQEDNSRVLCECEACVNMKNHYNGAEAGSIVIFLNGVAELVEAYFESEEGKPYARDFTILFFAYNITNQAPVTYNEETDTYSPIDEKVIPNEHLAPYIAATIGDYTKDFYDPDSANADLAENFKGWAAISEEIYFWMYSTNFNHYLTPYNTFDTTQATYKFAIENGAGYIVDQGQSNQTGASTGWSWLKIYLYSKLTWNVDQDINILIDRFMENYFGPAADIMKEVFYEWKAFANYQSDVLGYSGSRSINFDVLNAELWDRQILTSWVDRMTEAMEVVESVKYEDYAKYSLYVKNIAIERIAYNYLLMELYQPYMTAEAVARAKEQLYHDQSLANILRLWEQGPTVYQTFQSWGVFD